MPTPDFWLTLGVMAGVTTTDMLWRRVPDWLVLPYVVAGLLAGVAGQGWSGLERSLAGILAAAVPLGVLFLVGGLGGGDLKLGAAAGAWLGFDRTLLALVMMAMAGGVLAILYGLRWRALVKTARSRHPVCEFCAWLREPVERSPQLSIPYAPAIAAGVIFAMLAGPGPH